MTLERPSLGYSQSLTAWVLGPILGVLAIVVFGTQLPAKECSELTSQFSEHAGPRALLTLLGIAVSLLLGIAAAERFAAVRRDRGLEVPSHPLLWAVGFTCIGAALLILVPSLAAALYPIAILGFVGACASLLVLFDVQRRHGDVDEAGHALTVYLASAAFGLCPGVTLAALHFSLDPLNCSFT